MRVIWSIQSLEDLREIRKFIARDAPNTAASFIRRLRSSADRLRQLPESGQVVAEVGNPNIREVLHGPYRIIYELSSNRVEVLTVFHSARLLGEAEL